MNPEEPSPPAPMVPAPSRPAALAWVALYLVLFATLAYGVFAGLRMRCEGFGCVGVGVFWMAWAGVYAVAGLLGLWARTSSRRAGVAVGPVRVAQLAQLLGGLGLLVWWLLH